MGGDGGKGMERRRWMAAGEAGDGECSMEKVVKGVGMNLRGARVLASVG